MRVVLERVEANVDVQIRGGKKKTNRPLEMVKFKHVEEDEEDIFRSSLNGNEGSTGEGG